MANKKVSQLTSKPSVLTTDLFPIADPSTGQLYKTTISDLGTAIGSGVSSVNSLVGAVVLDTDDIQELVSPTNKWFTDTRARAALSASSPLTYNSGTGAFGIQEATSTQNGYLSSADWTTFNAKQAALSGTGFVKISGTTISYDNSTYLTTSSASSTYVPYTGATGNVNLGLDYSITAALIIKSGGTSTQFLKADGSIDTNTYLTTSSAASTYLPLAGGTLTGNLLGTNITISNSLIAKGGTFNGGASSSGIITMDGLGSDLLMNRADSSNGALITLLTNAGEMWRLGMRSLGNDNFYIYNSTLLANAVTINSTNSAVTLAGALSGTSATFSGNLDLSLASGDGVVKIKTLSATTNAYLDLWNPAQRWQILNNTDGRFSIYKVGGTDYFTLASTGAATFSSSVTAGGVLTANQSIILGGTTNNINSDNSLLLYSGNNNVYLQGSGGLQLFESSARNNGIGIQSVIQFFLSNAERMRITSVGAVQIGTRSDATQSTANLALNNTNYGGFHFLDGTAYYIGQNSNFRSLRMYSGGSTGTGVNLAAGATSWGTYSDERMKTDLMPIENATEKVSQLRSVIGRYKTDEQSKKRSFLIAQDVKEVLPEAISEDLQTGMLEIRYTEVIPLLVASIKELKAELDALKA